MAVILIDVMADFKLVVPQCVRKVSAVRVPWESFHNSAVSHLNLIFISYHSSPAVPEAKSDSYG